jgi:hypothetical protein
MNILIKVGNTTITPILEVDAGHVIQEGLPDATPESIKQIPWLCPSYADDNSKLKAQVQAFLIQAGGEKILVDSCVGDGRNRPDVPEWSHMQTGFMERFQRVWQPEEGGSS